MTSPSLLSPTILRGLLLRDRLVTPLPCQYPAEDGFANANRAGTPARLGPWQAAEG